MKKIISFALLTLLLVGLCACSSPEKTIVGTWKQHGTIVSDFTDMQYTFNEDGTGTITNIWTVDFTYTISDDKLFITTEVLSIKDTKEYKYQFDGDNMTLIGDNETLEFVRVEE